MSRTDLSHSPSLDDPSSSTPSHHEHVELKKDGTASKMRLHKGNIPSVPRTKSCPLCPARFTRTTHLSRHLRTHTREKLHECEKCHSQFTRSDLLNRHKRSCGDLGISRSRRKSCQACAESKVKCDLQHPCSKCKARGRDCIYVGGHAVASTSRTVLPPMYQDDLDADLLAILDAQINSQSPDFPDSSSSSVPLQHDFPGMMGPSSVRSYSSPESDALLSLPRHTGPSVFFSIDSLSTFARVDQTAPPPQKQFGDLMGNETFSDLFDGMFSPTQQMSFPALDAPAMQMKNAPREKEAFGENSVWDPNFPFPTAPVDLQQDTAVVQQDDSPSVSTAYSSPGPSDISSSKGKSSVASSVGTQNGPSPLELQTYLSLFFSAYLPNMPIIHAATFKVEDKSPLLVSAMQACGALYVKTRTAMNFIDTVLARARDELVVELARESIEWQHQIQLALAVDLFQTLGLFHQDSEQRAFSNIYHAMLAMMIRLNGFSAKTFDWEPPSVIDQSSAAHIWHEWALHETAKRALAVSYLHDCCHCIYFNLRPTYVTPEFDMPLPCEDALWLAPSADEWLRLLQQPSQYGWVSGRLRGPRLQSTYAKLAEPSEAPLMLNPWSHNILIHMVLRQLFEDFLEARLPEVGKKSMDSSPDAEYIGKERISTLQNVMHSWLQSWLSSPESPQYCDREPRFMNQALPYYWLAQVAIMAYQERLPPFCIGTTYIVSGEAKFRLMKKWERHVRNFLRKGGEEPTRFLDELVKSRMPKWDPQMSAPDPEEDSVLLLGFFPGT